VVTHLLLLLSQPSYLLFRYWLDPAAIATRSLSSWTIHLIIWSTLLTRVSIPFLKSPLRHLPAAPGQRILLGNFRLPRRNPLQFLDDLVKSNIPVVVTWGPLYLISEIVPTQPEVLMDMLNTHSYEWEKPALTKRALDPILGNGLVNVEGAEHKAMRKLVAPSFSGHQIRQLAPLFYTKGQILADIVARHARDGQDEAMDPTDLISRATLDIIGAAGVGMDFDTLEKDNMVLPKLYDSVIHAPFWFMLAQGLFPKWLLGAFKGTKSAKVVADQRRLRNEVRALMQRKKTDMKEQASTATDKDIIAHIMKSADVSDDYLVNQMLTFLAAGHETTASALAWAILLLSKHPEVQDRLRAECLAQAGNVCRSDVDASMFDAEKLPLLAAVCNETLRLYPPAPITSRQNIGPTMLAGQAIPKGTLASLPLYSINRSQALWGADAAEFKPDRWIRGQNAAHGGANSQFCFMSFLHGPRSCVGQSFARLEMKCILAALIMRLKFSPHNPEQEIEMELSLTIRPKNLRLKVYDIRDGAFL
jgi:cytochrome P450